MKRRRLPHWTSALATFMVLGTAQPSPGGFDAELVATGGRMPILVPGGCGGPNARPVTYGGFSGHVRYRTPPGGSGQHRFVAAAGLDQRFSGDAMPRPPLSGNGYHLDPITRVWLMGGWDTRWFALEAGAWVGNHGESLSFLGLPTARVRIGPEDKHIAFSLFGHGQNCLIAECLVSVEGGLPLHTGTLRAGASLAFDVGRLWLQVPLVELTPGLVLVAGGQSVFWVDEGAAIYSGSLGVRWLWF